MRDRNPATVAVAVAVAVTAPGSTTTTVPDDPATLYALTGALGNKATVENFGNIVKYAERMPAEFSVLCVSYASRKNEELASTEAFTKWAIAHQDVLF